MRKLLLPIIFVGLYIFSLISYAAIVYFSLLIGPGSSVLNFLYVFYVPIMTIIAPVLPAALGAVLLLPYGLRGHWKEVRKILYITIGISGIALYHTFNGIDNNSLRFLIGNSWQSIAFVQPLLLLYLVVPSLIILWFRKNFFHASGSPGVWLLMIIVFGLVSFLAFGLLGMYGGAILFILFVPIIWAVTIARSLRDGIPPDKVLKTFGIFLLLAIVNMLSLIGNAFLVSRNIELFFTIHSALLYTCIQRSLGIVCGFGIAYVAHRAVVERMTFLRILGILALTVILMYTRILLKFEPREDAPPPQTTQQETRVFSSSSSQSSVREVDPSSMDGDGAKASDPSRFVSTALGLSLPASPNHPPESNDFGILAASEAENVWFGQGMTLKRVTPKDYDNEQPLPTLQALASHVFDLNNDEPNNIIEPLSEVLFNHTVAYTFAVQRSFSTSGGGYITKQPLTILLLEHPISHDRFIATRARDDIVARDMLLGLQFTGQ